MHSGRISLKFIQFLRNNKKTPSLGIVSKCGNNFAEISGNGFPNLFTDFLTQNITKEEIEDMIPQLEIEEMTDHIKLLPPVINPSRILSLNFSKQKSIKNINFVLSNKLPSCLTGPTSKIVLPKNIVEFKCRPELGVIIGKKNKGCHIKRCDGPRFWIYGSFECYGLQNC